MWQWRKWLGNVVAKRLFRKPVKVRNVLNTRLLSLQQLEDRSVPAVLDVSAGALTYVGNFGTPDNLSISTNGTNYTFTDSAETIALTANAITAGWTGSGSHTVSGPDTSVHSIAVTTSDMNGNSVDVLSIANPISINTGSGTGNTVTIGGVSGIGAQDVNGNVSVQSSDGANNGQVAVVVDDSQDANATFPQLDPGDVVGILPFFYEVTYNTSDLSALTVKEGSGGNQTTVTNTVSGITTTVDTGTGGNFNLTTVQASTGPLTINGQGTNDYVVIGNSGNTNQVTGNVTVTDSEHDTNLTIDDSADSSPTDGARTVHVIPSRDYTGTGTAKGYVTGMLGGGAEVVWTAQSVGQMSINTSSVEDVTENVYAAPDQYAAIDINAGDDVAIHTLYLNLTGTLNPVLTDTGPGAGNVTSGDTAEMSWEGFGTIPIPIGLGGEFDMQRAPSPTDPVQAGYYTVTPSTTYTSGQGYGWTVAPARGYDGGYTTSALSGNPLSSLLGDGVDGGGNSGLNHAAVFRIDLVSNEPVQLTALLGDFNGPRSGLDVSYSLSDPALNDPSEPAAASTWVSFDNDFSIAKNNYLSVNSPDITPQLDGSVYSLWVRVANLNGGDPDFTLDGLVVRPQELVASLDVERQDGAPGTTAQYADGLTVDTYTVTGATANAVLTISATYGTVETNQFPALSLYNASTLSTATYTVETDANGDATFEILRPTGDQTSTITVEDFTGAAFGTFTQDYQLPEVRRIDFGPLTGPQAADANGQYLMWTNALYGPTTDVGWVMPPNLPNTLFNRGTIALTSVDPGNAGGEGTSVGQVLQDGESSVGQKDFEISVPSGGEYAVTIETGDQLYARPGVVIEQVSANGLSVVQGLDSPIAGSIYPTLTTAAGQFAMQTFDLTATSGVIRLRFYDTNPADSWVIDGIELRPLPATSSPAATPGPSSAPLPTEPQHQLTVSVTSAPTAPPANGTSTATFSISGATPYALITISSAAGTPLGTDASPDIQGFQVQANASGDVPSFAIQAPRTVGDIDDTVTAAEVTGQGSGSTPVTWVGSSQYYQMGTGANPLVAGATRVSGTTVFSSETGYGWATSVSSLDRHTANTLYRSFNYGVGSQSFELEVGSATSVTVTIYSSDPNHTNLAKETYQFGTNATQHRTADATTLTESIGNGGIKVVDGIGYLDLKIENTSFDWILNGIMVS